MKEYAERIAKTLRDKGYNAEAMVTEKANGVVKNCLSIRIANEQYGVVVYTDEMYKRHLSVNDACDYCISLYNENRNPEIPEMDYFSDYEKMKGNLYLRMYSNKTNVEVFRSAKKYGFDDLILVPVVRMEKGCIKVDNKIVTEWGVDKNTIFADALKNTKADVVEESMIDFIAKSAGVPKEVLDPIFPEQFVNTVIVSNSDMMYGASAIIGRISKYKKDFPNGFVVIPSSNHEVIVMDRDLCIDYSELKNMIGAVNGECLEDEDVLSDKPYVFANN